MGGGIAAKLIAADGIFTERNNVGVAEEYPRAQTRTNHPFYDGGGARRAAAVQQDALLKKIAAVRQNRSKTFLMNILAWHSFVALETFKNNLHHLFRVS